MNRSNAPHTPHRRNHKKQPWSEVYASLMPLEQEDVLNAEDLYTLALAAYLTGKDHESTTILARAHDQFLKKEDPRQAIRCAFWIGMLLMFKGELAKGNGWFSRAHHLLQNVRDDCPEKGLLSIPRALGQLKGGDAEKAYEEFNYAAKTGDRFNDPDLSTLSLLGCGQALIKMGKISDGLAQLDESMVAAEAERVSPIVIGLVYCAVIETCHMIFDIQRAEEWTTVLSQWCEAHPDIVPFRGQCLIRRSQIIHLHGDWSQALVEIQRACKILTQPPGEPAAGESYYHLAEAFRLLGDFTEAEKFYQEAYKWGRKPQPGLALVRLAQGQTESAVASIQNALDEVKDPPRRLHIIPAYIEIMIEAHKMDQVLTAVGELSSMTEKFNTPYVHALSTFCKGSVLFEEGKTGEALKMLRRSCELWRDLNAPYQAARVRLLMGIAYRQNGDEDSALMEFNASRLIFSELEAIPDLKKVEALIAHPDSRNANPLTLREMQVLRLVAAGEMNKIIADRLFISERTVERHLTNIFNKLKVNSRTAATAYGYKNNIL